jgi:hypothetical protein
MRFFGGVNRDEIKAYMKIPELQNVRHAFDRVFKRFSERMAIVMLPLGRKVGHLRLREKFLNL